MQNKLGQYLSHRHINVIGYCDILDIVTILALSHGGHNIRYLVYLSAQQWSSIKYTSVPKGLRRAN